MMEYLTARPFSSKMDLLLPGVLIDIESIRQNGTVTVKNDGDGVSWHCETPKRVKLTIEFILFIAILI